MVYINDKIYTDECYQEVEGSWESYNTGYYRSKQKLITCDGYEFDWTYSSFSNISDVVGDYTEVTQDTVTGSINYEISWEDKSWEIEEKEEEIKDLKTELKELQEEQEKYESLMNKFDELREEIEEKEEEIKDLKTELKELQEEQEEYESLMNKLEDNSTIMLDNIGLGATTNNDFKYWEVKIDVVNGVATYSDYEETVVTDDLTWVENFLLNYWNWFTSKSVLEYIVEHQDFFDVEIVEKEH